MKNPLVSQLQRMVSERSRAGWHMGSEPQTQHLIVRTRMPMDAVLTSIREFKSLHEGKLTIEELIQACVQAGNASDETCAKFSRPRQYCCVSHISLSSRLLGDRIVRAALFENAKKQAAESAKNVGDQSGSTEEILFPACVISGADKLSQLLPDLSNDFTVQNSAIVQVRSNFPGDAHCMRVARGTRTCLHYLMTQQLLLATALDL